jgi:Spy/CpxP family protein refolding chaperone
MILKLKKGTNMFKLKLFSFVLLLAVLISTGNIFAQVNDKPKKTPEERAKFRADKMKENLNLTDEQYQSIYSMMLTNMLDRKSLREQYSTDKEGFKKAMKEKRKNNREQLKNILNDDQKAKMKQMRKQHRHEKGKFKIDGRKKHKTNQ